MNITKCRAVAAFLIFVSSLVAQDLATARPATQDLAAKVDVLCQPLITAEVTVGFVVGVIDGDTELVRGFGKIAPGGAQAPDGTTLYEIGSISKVFTSLLLADAVERGLVALEDPVQKHLPAGVELKPWGGDDILLWHLATHSSGLPRMPRLEAPDANNPYSHINAEVMNAAISDTRARRTPGSKYEYSNLGAAMLGYVLMLKNGCQTYDEVLAKRITGPLAMKETAVVLSEALQARLAPPHDGDGAPSHTWDLAMMAGAGGIRSTVPDMLKFARLELAPGESPLAKAVVLSQQKHHEGQGGIAVALGWHIARDGVSLWHNGQTGGYHGYLGVVPKTRRAVCILTNTSGGHIDALGEGILQTLHGQEVKPLALEAPVIVDKKHLERLVGKYRAMPGMEFEITLPERGLCAQLTGQPCFRLFARSPTEFFYRVVEASITFEFEGEGGSAQKLVLHQNGRDIPAKRIVDDK